MEAEGTVHHQPQARPKPRLSYRIQEDPEPAIEGNRLTGQHVGVGEILYVIVLADGVPVAQQSFYFAGSRWWVDDLFVARSQRGTEVVKLLREITFREVAKRADAFYAWIEYRVASPEKVLGDPIKKALGVKIEVMRRMRFAAKYRYDVRELCSIWSDDQR